MNYKEIKQITCGVAAGIEAKMVHFDGMYHNYH
jgi:hypothetical protein